MQRVSPPDTGLTGLYIPKDAKGNPFNQAVSVHLRCGRGGGWALESHAELKAAGRWSWIFRDWAP